jgi:protein TonB
VNGSQPPVRTAHEWRDPLEGVRRLGREKHTFAVIMACLIALFVHGTAAARVAMIDTDLLAWSRAMRLVINEHLAATYDIEVDKPKPAAPPAPKEEPKDEPKPPPPPPKAAPETPPPPPAPAMAGKVITAAPDPNVPVDFTNTFVVGNGDTYAGGVTQATGTSTTAVRDLNAQPGGVPGGTGTKPAPAAPLVDHSRQPVVRVKDWHCDFPPEADSEQIDEMKVPVQISVDDGGHVTDVRVLRDPGMGFARAATQCARRQGPSTWDVALDRDGHPIPATFAVNVNFSR